MAVENRRSQRVDAPFYVKIGYNFTEFEKKWEENVAKNVSECGIAIMTARDYPKDVFLTLLMRIPTQPTLDWVEAYGKVIESTKVMENVYITRINFQDLNPAVKEAIKRYVDWALKK